MEMNLRRKSRVCGACAARRRQPAQAALGPRRSCTPPPDSLLVLKLHCSAAVLGQQHIVALRGGAGAFNIKAIITLHGGVAGRQRMAGSRTAAARPTPLCATPP